jgi:hypothetical protein
MTKLTLMMLYIWSALAFAAANKNQLHKPYGEWFKVGLRVAQQQPVSFEFSHVLFALDPHGHWLHAASTLTA